MEEAIQFQTEVNAEDGECSDQEDDPGMSEASVEISCQDDAAMGNNEGEGQLMAMEKRVDDLKETPDNQFENKNLPTDIGDIDHNDGTDIVEFDEDDRDDDVYDEESKDGEELLSCAIVEDKDVSAKGCNVELKDKGSNVELKDEGSNKDKGDSTKKGNDNIKETPNKTVISYADRLSKYNTHKDEEIPEPTAPAVNQDLANFVNKTMTSTLASDEFRKLGDKFLRPENTPMLVVPRVNKIIWQILPVHVQQNDMYIQQLQRRVVKSIHPLVEAMDKLHGHDEVLSLIQDSFEMLASASMGMNIKRRLELKPHLNTMKKFLLETPVTSELFGDNLEIKLMHFQHKQESLNESSVAPIRRRSKNTNRGGNKRFQPYGAGNLVRGRGTVRGFTTGYRGSTRGRGSIVGNQGSTVGNQGSTVGNQGSTVGNQGSTVGNQGSTVGNRGSIRGRGSTVGNRGSTRGRGSTIGNQGSTGGYQGSSQADKDSSQGYPVATSGSQGYQYQSSYSPSYQGATSSSLGYQGATSSSLGYQGATSSSLGYQGATSSSLGYQGATSSSLGYQGATKGYQGSSSLGYWGFTEGYQGSSNTVYQSSMEGSQGSTSGDRSSRRRNRVWRRRRKK